MSLLINRIIIWSVVTVSITIALFSDFSSIMGAAKSALGLGGDKPVVRVQSFYNLQARKAESQQVLEFEHLRGKVVLVANVASKCGLTDSMYNVLGTLAQKYGPTNQFVVLGFPCGQFMNQEFKTSEETCPFVRGLLSKFGAIQENDQFILMEKVDVNGSETHPVFSFLKYNSPLYDEANDLSGPIKWNFGKFLIDKEGRVIKYYGPTDDKIEEDVQAAIDGKLMGSPSRAARM